MRELTRRLSRLLTDEEITSLTRFDVLDVDDVAELGELRRPRGFVVVRCSGVSCRSNATVAIINISTTSSSWNAQAHHSFKETN